MATAMNMLNIPFKECFTVNSVWEVKPLPAGHGCEATIHLKVGAVRVCVGVCTTSHNQLCMGTRAADCGAWA